MSDQDFFFDEEEETVAPAKQSAKPSTKSSATKSSSAKSAPAARKSAPVEAAPAAGAGFFEQSVSMSVAALMTVIGLLVGVIIGFVVAPDGGTSVSTTGTGAAAPQLSSDQLQSGDLPAGHPDISGMGGSAVPTETPEAAPAE